MGAPAAFAAALIRDKGEVAGVLAIQLSNQEIDKVVSGNRGWEQEGLGKSGDSGIVGPDYLLRSNARGFLQRREEALDQMRARGIPADTIARIRAYGSTVLQQHVRLPSVEAALGGEEGTRIQVGSAGKASLVSYMPSNPRSALDDRVQNRFSRSSRASRPVPQNALMVGSLTLSVTAVIALILTRTILLPVNRLVDAA